MRKWKRKKLIEMAHEEKREMIISYIGINQHQPKWKKKWKCHTWSNPGIITSMKKRNLIIIGPINRRYAKRGMAWRRENKNEIIEMAKSTTKKSAKKYQYLLSKSREIIENEAQQSKRNENQRNNKRKSMKEEKEMKIRKASPRLRLKIKARRAQYVAQHRKSSKKYFTIIEEMFPVEILHGIGGINENRPSKSKKLINREI